MERNTQKSNNTNVNHSENQNNIEEIVLIEEKDSNRNDEEGTNTSNSEIMLTDEEYFLECARFGEIKELIAFMNEVKSFDVNSRDFRGNTALRKNLLN